MAETPCCTKAATRRHGQADNWQTWQTLSRTKNDNKAGLEIARSENQIKWPHFYLVDETSEPSTTCGTCAWMLKDRMSRSMPRSSWWVDSRNGGIWTDLRTTCTWSKSFQNPFKPALYTRTILMKRLAFCGVSNCGQSLGVIYSFLRASALYASTCLPSRKKLLRVLQSLLRLSSMWNRQRRTNRCLISQCLYSDCLTKCERGTACTVPNRLQILLLASFIFYCVQWLWKSLKIDVRLATAGALSWWDWQTHPRYWKENKHRETQIVKLSKAILQMKEIPSCLKSIFDHWPTHRDALSESL